jgi:hypothetical protein
MRERAYLYHPITTIIPGSKGKNQLPISHLPTLFPSFLNPVIYSILNRTHAVYSIPHFNSRKCMIYTVGAEGIKGKIHISKKVASYVVEFYFPPRIWDRSSSTA